MNDTSIKSKGASEISDSLPEESAYEERYIPINKGHFDLDTPDRTRAFSEKLAQGWEKEYEEYRRLWVDLAKTRQIRDYPLLVDLELSSRCNLNCPMCYTTTEAFLSKVDRKYMEIDLFKKIIDEIAGKVFAVRLSLRGEATLNRHFIEAVAYAKQNGIKEVSTLTHGKKFTGDYLRKAVEAGIDWITISVDGIGETYNSIRKPLKWEETLGRLKEIKALKTEIGVMKPVIKVQGIWPAIRENPTAYFEALEPYTDLIAYNPLIDYLHNDLQIVYEENFACPQLYQRLVVGSDGKVMMCSNDEDALHPVGDAYQQTIHEIWHGDAMNNVRQQHSHPDGFKELEVCRHCYYPRKAVPDETAYVGGRKITIENYVNRAQQVGK
ncbi:radical SAM protein [Chlorobium sp. BLA1]|uniref:radical SAM/SPASM domain-containing protein n=1 Tax=Candidatus Chlorobium masyuteum TaxID=2716876 RepID=UPI00141F6D67|nr:radical SAM/SPASM domain-containing protein [Candidatus Chlorobium masyuteum]NHQ59200.1 radical SAM protein [Candidatus Chlorobium masyuteum]